MYTNKGSQDIEIDALKMTKNNGSYLDKNNYFDQDQCNHHLPGRLAGWRF